MKPVHARLTCRAHNRFSPSIALWQYFVGPERPLLSQRRYSSNVAEAVQKCASKDANQSDSPASDGIALQEAQLDGETGPGVIRKLAQPQVRIRKKSTAKGTWHADKVDASIARNIRNKHATRQASKNAPDRLLAIAKAAFEASEDYIGETMDAMEHPEPIKESQLPWCLPMSEKTMWGSDRLAIEIERFYEYAQPNHYEEIVRRHLIKQVRQDVHRLRPDHVLETFGSERTGLAFATSDIDMRFTTTEKMEDTALSRLPPTIKERLDLMKHLKVLYWNGLRTQEAYLHGTLRHARYPLISLQDRESGIDVQIVLSNDTSLSREFVKKYMQKYPYLRQLYFVIKTMLDIRGLTNVFKGGFGSYSLFMMIVAAIRKLPNPRKDAAGGLVNFLKVYRRFDCARYGIQIEPWSIFHKDQTTVLSAKTKAQLRNGQAKPLPPYMLCIRDPADETNDLGRKGVAIKHFQATVTTLHTQLTRDLQTNTRASLLGPLVGPSYMLHKERRQKIGEYGKRLSDEMKTNLAVNARLVREGVESGEAVGTESQDFLAEKENSAAEKHLMNSARPKEADAEQA